jgi:Putative  PD-(D/E)XK family member, (DUF4420)
VTERDSNARHIDREGLRQYLSAGAHAALKVEGIPALYLIVEPASHTLRLRAPQAKNTLPDVSAYKNLAAEIIYWRGAQWCQLSISGPVIVDAYPLLIAIADRIQMLGTEFAVATRSALVAFREVLAEGSVLSAKAEIGLFGELLVLLHLLATMPPQLALDAWRGHEPEEHDFGLPELDLEVKTTTSETRLHWINSLTQLRPTLERPLYLGSLQLTAAGADGLTLAEMAARTEAAVPLPLRESLLGKLSAAGWREATRSLYVRRFRLRTKPLLYSIVDGFPTLTPEKLAVVKASDAIVQLRYMIDLSNVTPAALVPPPLTKFFQEGST